jgi:hypothetical protein
MSIITGCGSLVEYEVGYVSASGLHDGASETNAEGFSRLDH